MRWLGWMADVKKSTKDQDSHPESHLWFGLGNNGTLVEVRGRLWLLSNAHNHIVSHDSLSHCKFFMY